jgi:hypothetical protein
MGNPYSRQNLQKNAAEQSAGPRAEIRQGAATASSAASRSAFGEGEVADHLMPHSRG